MPLIEYLVWALICWAASYELRGWVALILKSKGGRRGPPGPPGPPGPQGPQGLSVRV